MLLIVVRAPPFFWLILLANLRSVRQEVPGKNTDCGPTFMAVLLLAGHRRVGYNISNNRRIVMRQLSGHLLWLGNAGDGRDHKRVLDTGIQAVVQVAAEEPVLQLPRDLIYSRFPLVDGLGNDLNVLELAITTVAYLLEKKVPTLVVCGAGLSRSPAIAAAAIAVIYQRPEDECLKEIAEHFPADVAPDFWAEVKMLWKVERFRDAHTAG
jgi:hypothetical protein